MRRGKKQAEEEGSGAPEWMVTFSDCMTLLLTFFVLLLSFSSFDDRIYRRLRSIYSDAFSTISLSNKIDRDSFQTPIYVEVTTDLEQGSEKPTTADSKQLRSMRDTTSDDFNRHKVFLRPSSKLFWGRSTAISQEGNKCLAALAELFKKMPGRIVISENSGDSRLRLYKGKKSAEDTELGLTRAWVLLEHLTTQGGLDRNRFSISASSTLAENSRHEKGGSGETQRTVEITLLERSIYN